MRRVQVTIPKAFQADRRDRQTVLSLMFFDYNKTVREITIHLFVALQKYRIAANRNGCKYLAVYEKAISESYDNMLR